MNEKMSAKYVFSLAELACVLKFHVRLQIKSEQIDSP